MTITELRQKIGALEAIQREIKETNMTIQCLEAKIDEDPAVTSASLVQISSILISCSYVKAVELLDGHLQQLRANAKRSADEIGVTL